MTGVSKVHICTHQSTQGVSIMIRTHITPQASCLAGTARHALAGPFVPPINAHEARSDVSSIPFRPHWSYLCTYLLTGRPR